MWLGGASITPALVLLSVMLCAILTEAGEWVLWVSRWREIKARLPLAFTLGFVVLSLPMMALTLIFGLSAFTALIISAVPLFVLGFYRIKNSSERFPVAWTDLMIAAALSIVLLLLTRIPLASPVALKNSGVLHLWSDYYLHGVTISSFGSPLALGMNMQLAGVSRFFYHYAPYLIPASFQSVSGLSGLALATSCLLPMGLLIAAFGTYVFAVELGGRLSGLVALTGIICLPAYSIFIHAGWFDFDWLMFASPGGGYAVGVAAAACAAMLAYLKQQGRKLFLLTVALLFSLLFIRLQMFMLLAPAILGVELIHRWPSKIRALRGAMLGVIMIGILALCFSPDLHALWLKFSDPYGYLKIVLEHSRIQFSMIAVELTMVLIAVLGIYFVFYPLMLRLNIRRFGFHPIDALPLFVLVNFVALMLFAPMARNGDLTEYKHRHFPLVYVLIAIYTIAYAGKLMKNDASKIEKVKPWVYSFLICIFAGTIFLNWNLNPARPDAKTLPWSMARLHNQVIRPGLLESAEYLQAHARPGDVLAMGEASVKSISDGPLIELSSLSGIAAFIGRPAVQVKEEASSCVGDIVNKRMALLKILSSIHQWVDVQKILQENGVRWFLVPEGEKPAWDPDRNAAVFSNQGMSIYDAGMVSEILKKPQCSSFPF